MTNAIEYKTKIKQMDDNVIGLGSSDLKDVCLSFSLFHPKDECNFAKLSTWIEQV